MWVEKTQYFKFKYCIIPPLLTSCENNFFFSTTHRISATSLWISRHELKPSPQGVQESRSHWIYICCKVINVFVSDVATDLLLTMWVTKTSLLTHFIPKLKHSLSKHCICGKLELFYNKNVSVLHLLMLPGWSTAVILLLCPSRNNNRPAGNTGIIWTPSTNSHMMCGLKNTTVARFILKHISLSGTNFY